MSRPRYDWWPYVKGMIRRYPELKAEYADLHKQSITPNYAGIPGNGSARRTVEDVAIRELPKTRQREYEAVRQAVETMKHITASQDRIKVIDLVFWKRSHTLEGAALMIPCSYRTARRYHTEFIMLVAGYYGLLDE